MDNPPLSFDPDAARAIWLMSREELDETDDAAKSLARPRHHVMCEAPLAVLPPEQPVPSR